MRDRWIAAVALVVGVSLGACFGSECLDESELDYTLGVTRYEATAAEIGVYAPDDDVVMRVDEASEQVTLTFTEDGAPIEIVYDIVEVAFPE